MQESYSLDSTPGPAFLEARKVSVHRGASQLVKGVSLVVPEGAMVALMGPMGAGKGALLRAFNRLHELSSDVRVEGEILLRGQDLLGSDMDPALVRKKIGMIFPKPNPFPGSIAENVAFGPRLEGRDEELGGVVEECLKAVGLWSEVSDRLQEAPRSLTQAQQQRMCIARALAVDPEVLLLDRPTSALDSEASRGMEELFLSLKEKATIVLSTHDIRQAARISDFTAFLHKGDLVEYGPTDSLFTNPRESLTEAYVTGRLE